jgi:phage regulator Rha-like protein
MNALVNTNTQTMTSLEIAELVEKRHDNVKRTIESLINTSVIVQPQIEDEHSSDKMGRSRTTQTYAMNDYMMDRFYLFSLQWLKYGKQFVNELDSSMMSKYVEVHRQIGLAKVA